MPKENKPTLAFVVVMLMAVVAAFLSEIDVHPGRLVAYAVALVFELWAIANKRKGDTISEGFWELSSRPFVPWCCGALFLYYTTNGTITDVREIAALAGLQMHFFWQADSVYQEITAAAAPVCPGCGIRPPLDDACGCLEPKYRDWPDARQPRGNE